MNIARLFVPVTLVALSLIGADADAAPRSKRASKAAKSVPALSVARPLSLAQAQAAKVAGLHDGFFEQARSAAQVKGAQNREEVKTAAARLQIARTAARHARTALLDSIANQAAHGRFDKALIRSRMEAVVDTAVTEDAAERNAIETLHESMDREQRIALTEALSHGTDKSKEHERIGKAVEKLGTELKLTAEQKKSLRGLFARLSEQTKAKESKRRTSYRRVIEAFKTENLAVDRVVPPAEARTGSERSARELVHFVQTIAPKLTPEQRHRLASILRARAHQGRASLEF